MSTPIDSCARKIHETCGSGSGRPHRGMRTEAAAAILCSRSRARRADSRAAHVDGRAGLSRRNVRRGLHRCPERRGGRSLRESLRRGQSAAAARDLPAALQRRGHAARGGGWNAYRDPLTTAITGFRLSAALRAKPSITTSAVVTPDYGCLQHAFGFRGDGAGASGPQVTVRLGILRSPFYDRLLVAGIEVEDAPPYYVLADARAVPPSDWLIIEARGSHGSRG